MDKWIELYKMAKEYRKLKPWAKIWNTDLICIRYESGECCYASVMGNGGIEYGLMLTTGKDAEYEIRKILYSAIDDSAQAILGAEINSMNICISEKSQVPDEQLGLIKNLGMSFKGNNWIYFERYEAGYVPSMLSDEEVLEFKRHMPYLLEAIKEYIKIHTNEEPNIDNIFVYESKNGVWSGHFEKFSFEQFEWRKAIFDNEVMATKIVKKIASSEIWEFGMFCPPDEIKDEQFKKPVIAKTCVWADSKKEKVLSFHMAMPTDNAHDILNEMAQYIDDNKKPKKIIVGSKYSYAFLEDFCSKTKIKLEVGKVPTINNFYIEYQMNDEDYMMAEVLERMLVDSGIDLEELEKRAKGMSDEEFEKEIMPSLMGKLIGIYDDDIYDDDILYEDESDFYDVVVYESKAQKIKAVHDFFLNKDKLKVRRIDYDYDDITLTEFLGESSQEELFAVLDELGVLVSPNISKKTLSEMLMNHMKKNVADLVALLNKNEKNFLKEIYKRADMMDSEHDLKEFKYAESDVIRLLQLNLIDVLFLVSENEAMLVLARIEGLRL